ncbi:BgTH12-06580 [Blumeria graminis f. sp. triticale]|uniref:BgTH12-06580 n=1 Tax=Blumeria graminis f. sp. triticale TaxID=1689686 RepID=A0A9W4CXW8_BLUGR|nr:BgTH12-06580 [Blumeria graminis f. sp. triticale]
MSSTEMIEKPDDSYTAAEYVQPPPPETTDAYLINTRSQLQLEADAREALPYKFDQCTKPLGKLRQSLFSCLTCNPAPDDPNEKYNAASVCYSCSIQCHGEHTLVELFVKREFECDCGTTRFPITSPCTLRIDPVTNKRGSVHSEKPSATNKYNQNFRNRFCGCKCLYDAEEEKGTMYQCLGLGTAETGGCGEDWWHPECILGLDRESYEDQNETRTSTPLKDPKGIETTTEAPINRGEESCEEGRFTAPLMTELNDCSEGEGLTPPGFPNEDDFEGFICYKCVDAYPWIKRYAGTPGFLPAIYRKKAATAHETDETESTSQTGKKRKVEGDNGEPAEIYKRNKKETIIDNIELNRTSNDNASTEPQDIQTSSCRIEAYPVADKEQFSLFFKEDFRSYLCHCNSCFPKLQVHPQLLQAEEVYEPSVASSHCDLAGSTAGSGSIYDRGESALQNIDRVQAIEGVMAYKKLKDKLKPFFQQFAQSGEAISAEDIKAYFAKIRGDELPVQEAGEATEIGNQKHEQHGY